MGGGPLGEADDRLLKRLVMQYGKNWATICQNFNRNCKGPKQNTHDLSYRFNYRLHPSKNSKLWTKEEDAALLMATRMFDGIDDFGRWIQISEIVGSRTD